MNQTASSLADSKELGGAVQNEKLSYAEGDGNKEVILSLKNGVAIASYFHFGDTENIYKADDLITSADQVISRGPGLRFHFWRSLTCSQISAW